MSNSRLNGRHATAIIGAVCVAIILAPVVAQAGGTASRTTQTVKVSNFPKTQNVAGTITAVPGLPGTPFAEYNQTSVASTTINVPAGHHLVVQSVSVRIGITSGDKFNLYLGYVTSGSTSYMFIPVTFSRTVDGTDFYVGNVTTEIYADPGSHLTLTATPDAGTTLADALSVSGYETS